MNPAVSDVALIFGDECDQLSTSSISRYYVYPLCSEAVHICDNTLILRDQTEPNRGVFGADLR
jgi:hypothetical protein